MTAEPQTLDRALGEHRRAVDAFIAALEAVPAERWATPLGEGRWTPGQLGDHIALSYGIAIEALAGGPGMRIVLPWWKRLFLRLTVLRRILAGGGFPQGAPAPRELRPGKALRPRGATLAELAARVAEGERALAAASPGTRLPHAYFGHLRCDQLLRVQAAHLDHHRRQLETAAALG